MPTCRCISTGSKVCIIKRVVEQVVRVAVLIPEVEHARSAMTASTPLVICLLSAIGLPLVFPSPMSAAPSVRSFVHTACMHTCQRKITKAREAFARLVRRRAKQLHVAAIPIKNSMHITQARRHDTTQLPW